MRPLAAVLMTVLLAGCSGSDRPDGPESIEPHHVFAIDADRPAGVYTARLFCTAVAASSAAFDLDDGAGADDTWLRGSMVVGDRSRIEVKRGEYLHTYGCVWKRETGDERTPDPTTLAGRCAILVGEDHLAEEALSFAGKALSPDDSSHVALLQERLMTVGFQMGQVLSGPAGILVDVLDDPVLYGPGGRIGDEAIAAVAKIKRVCR